MGGVGYGDLPGYVPKGTYSKDCCPVCTSRRERQEAAMRTTVNPAKPRLTVEQVIESKQSMLGGAPLPIEYGRIETSTEAIAAAVPEPRTVTLRVHIIWDNVAKEFPLERVLDHMRETGAAMVVKVEQVKP